MIGSDFIIIFKINFIVSNIEEFLSVHIIVVV